MNYSIDIIEEEEDYDGSNQAFSNRTPTAKAKSFLQPAHKTTRLKQQQQRDNVTSHFSESCPGDNYDEGAPPPPPTSSKNRATTTDAALSPKINSHAATVTKEQDFKLFCGDDVEKTSSASSSSFFNSFPFIQNNNMYHHIPTPISPLPSPTSSSSKLYMDQNEYYDNNSRNRESILMNKALLLQDNTKKKNKRESASGKIRPISSTSTSSSSTVLPRTTKSATHLKQQQQFGQHKRRNSSISLMMTTQQQGGGKRNNNRYFSLQPAPPRKTTTTTATSNIHQQQQQQQHAQLAEATAEAGEHWDPHIDAFDILRAKITGITRSMQEFHVAELFNDEELFAAKRKKLKLSATTSSPLITTTTTTTKRNGGGRRFSLVAAVGTTTTTNTATDNLTGHRRIKSSHDAIPFDHPPHSSSLGDEKDTFSYDYQDSSEEEEEEEEEIDKDRMTTMTSPNLTALFTTTNNLINSRLDELSETASIFSCNNNNNSQQEQEVTSKLQWQKKFLSLVTSCIHQSEALESLSTDVLNTEQRVRELLLVNETLHEQFNEREKQYEERIRECQDVAQQQLMMIESLEELTADINMKVESSSRKRKEQHRQDALLALVNGKRSRRSSCVDDEEEDDEEEEDNKRWDFQKSVAELLHMDDKYDLVQKMRWDIGMFVGGGVGTGHIIHTFEDKLNGIDMMIAGTGTTTTSTPTRAHFDECYTTEEEDEEEYDAYRSSGSHRRRSRYRYSTATESYSISPSISHHIKLYQHQYILHLTAQDRNTRFALLPKSLWVPDEATNSCQFQYCSTKFTFFQRRHHCRKCGAIVCQRHSANRLPLFSSRSVAGQWSRVCDFCFHDLIMQK